MSRILGLFAAALMMSEANLSGPRGSVASYSHSTEPVWKRKTCKSCVSCGGYCNGKFSKPSGKACVMYSKKNK